MKAVRQILVFPLELVLWVIVFVTVIGEFLGCFVGLLCQLVGGNDE